MDIQPAVRGPSINAGLRFIKRVTDRYLCSDGTVRRVEIDMSSHEGARDGAIGGLELCDFAVEVLQGDRAIGQGGFDGPES